MFDTLQCHNTVLNLYLLRSTLFKSRSLLVLTVDRQDYVMDYAKDYGRLHCNSVMVLIDLSQHLADPALYFGKAMKIKEVC